MKKMKLAFKMTLMMIVLGFFMFPAISFAGDYQVDGKTIHYEGLVPCGKSEPGPDESPEVATSCQLCHIFVMIKGIVDFIILKMVPVIAVLILTAGGVMFLVPRGDPGKVTQAKSMLTATVAGFVIILSAWLIVNTIFTLTGFMNPDFGWDLTKWFQIECRLGFAGQQPTPPTGTAARVVAPTQITANLPPESVPAGQPSAQVALGTDMLIKLSGGIVNSTPNQNKEKANNQISGVFANFGKTNIAFAQEAATQYRRVGQSAITYTKIEIIEKAGNTIEIAADLVCDEKVKLPGGDIIERVEPVVSVFNSDTRELLQNLTPESFSNVGPDTPLTFRSSFERTKNGNYVNNIYLYFKGTFHLSLSGKTYYIDPAGLDVAGNKMPPLYEYNINGKDFPRPTATDIMNLIGQKPVRGSGIWGYYPGYGWQESLEDGSWDAQNQKWVWTLRKDNYGTAKPVLPRCQIPEDGWGAPSPEARVLIQDYYKKQGIPCESTTAAQRVDLILYQNGTIQNKEIASDILNTGFYVWKVSDINPAIYNIKVRNAANSIISQTGLFEIIE